MWKAYKSTGRLTSYAFDQLRKSRSSKCSKYSGSFSRRSNASDHSEKQSLLATQSENKATHNLKLLKVKQKLKETEANEQLKQAKEKCSPVEVTPVSYSEHAKKDAIN